MRFIRYESHRRLAGTMSPDGRILEIVTDEPLGAAQTRRPPRASLPAADRGTTASASLAALDVFANVGEQNFMDLVEKRIAKDGRLRNQRARVIREMAREHPQLHAEWVRAQREAHWQTRRGKRGDV